MASESMQSSHWPKQPKLRNKIGILRTSIVMERRGRSLTFCSFLCPCNGMCLRMSVAYLTQVNSGHPGHHSGSCNGLCLRMSVAHLTLVNSSHPGHHSDSCNGMCLRMSVAYLTQVNSSHPVHHSGSCDALFSQQWPNCRKSMVGGLPVARNSSQPACALMHDIVQ